MGKLLYYACAAAVACLATFAAPTYASTATDGADLVQDRQLLVVQDRQSQKPSPFFVIAIAAVQDARPEVRIERTMIRDDHVRHVAAINPLARRAIGSAPGWLHAPPG